MANASPMHGLHCAKVQLPGTMESRQAGQGPGVDSFCSACLQNQTVGKNQIQLIEILAGLCSKQRNLIQLVHTSFEIP